MTQPIVQACEALGCCTDYEAIVTGPCGRGTVAVLENPLTVQFTRQLDEVSTARVVVGIPGASPDCCEALSEVRAWCHELHLFRCGVEVWSGPLMIPTWTADQVVLAARDNGAWLDRTVVKNTRTDFGDLTYLADRLIQENVPGVGGNSAGAGCLIVDARPTGIVAERKWEALSGYVGDKLRELGRQGLDWTFIGRRLVLAGGASSPLSLLGPLTDEHFLNPLAVVEDGVAAANRAYVVGKGVTGFCEVDDDGCGPVEVLRKEEGIETQADAQRLACALVAGGWPTPVRLDGISGAALTADAPICVEDMVPGVAVRIYSSATCREIVTDMRLTTLQVQAGQENESVQVTLSPTGADEFGFDFADIEAAG